MTKPYCPECPHCAELNPKPAATSQCEFSIAWVGRCKNPSVESSNVCELHAQKTCRCGRQAVRECDAVIGPMVCGMPACGSCRCH